MTIEAIAEALAGLGFKPSKPKKRAAYCFAGNITCHGEAVPIEFEICDLDFVELPRIRLLKRPKKLDGFQPHLGEHDELCYANKGEVLLDRYRPEGNALACLKKASIVLESLSSKDPPKDTHEEFTAYWPGSLLLIGCPPDRKGTVQLNMLKAKSLKRFLLASDDASQVERLLRIGWTKDDGHYGNCHILNSSKVAAVHGATWPPRTLAEVLNWIKEIDIASYRKIEGQLANEWVLESPYAAFIVRAPNFSYGFRFPVDRIHRKSYKRKPTWYREHLLRGNGKNLAIELLAGYPFDPLYIHGRNLADEKNLRDKKIMLIGCGTIGGYLATYLARLGAGHGKHGKLILADSEPLMPGNIGRHILGMRWLFHNKAEALASFIEEEFPYLSIDARPVDARDAKETMEVDLLIDATGEEALSVAINERITQLRKQNRKAPTVLYVWISGTGSAVQSLLVDSLDTACYRCMRIEQNDELVERFSALKNNSEKAIVRVGCEIYMPFPVSTSVQAAALGLEVALDWIRGGQFYRLRTKIIDVKNGRAVKDQNPTPLSNCPACGKT